MTTNNPNMATLIVDVGHSPWAFIYRLFKPTITIDAEKYTRPWGIHSFDLAAGDHAISVSYPWLLMRECGKNSVVVGVKPGDTRKVTYRAGLIRYLPGKITVE